MPVAIIFLSIRKMHHITFSELAHHYKYPGLFTSLIFVDDWMYWVDVMTLSCCCAACNGSTFQALSLQQCLLFHCTTTTPLCGWQLMMMMMLLLLLSCDTTHLAAIISSYLPLCKHHSISASCLMVLCQCSIFNSVILLRCFLTLSSVCQAILPTLITCTQQLLL